jgi:thiamine-phosphate pyrophosphorylase
VRTVFLVTDPVYSDEQLVRVVDSVGSTLPSGALGVQLRDKVRSAAQVRALAMKLRRATSDHGALFIVNGDAELAREVGADGVHLGGGAISVADVRAICGADAWVSVASHSDAAVRAALADGANAVLVSPIFPTAPPRGPAPSESRVRVRDLAIKSPRGVAALSSARTLVAARIALYALGGVTSENAASCVEAGADGVAVIRAVFASRDPAEAARALHASVVGASRLC